MSLYSSIYCRSSLHGRGLNRFWSNIEGYQGPLFVAVHAVSQDTRDDCTNELKWTVGVLTFQGFENKDLFYGSGGNIYALSPVFHAYPAAGRMVWRRLGSLVCQLFVNLLQIIIYREGKELCL